MVLKLNIHPQRMAEAWQTSPYSPSSGTYQKGYVRSGGSVAGGIGAVIDRYFTQNHADHGVAGASALAVLKVAATLPFALGDALYRIASEIPRGPVPTFARAAQLFISGPFEAAHHLGESARQTWDSRSHLSSAQGSYIWTQHASQLALLVLGGVKMGRGMGSWMDGVGPDFMPVMAGESMAAVATISVPALPASVMMGPLMMSDSANYATAVESVRRNAVEGNIKPHEQIALWQTLIPQVPVRLFRQTVAAVLNTLEATHDSAQVVVALLRKALDFSSTTRVRSVIVNTVDPQISGAHKWAKIPALWQGYVAELSAKRPEALPTLGHEFLKWSAKLKREAAFQEAVPGIWQQMLDGMTAISEPVVRRRILDRMGEISKGRPGLTPDMKSALDRAMQSKL